MDDLNIYARAVDALGVLAKDTWLSMFRMSDKAGPDGMIAGAFAN